MRNVAVKMTLVWTSLILVGLFFAGAGYAAIDLVNMVGLWLFDEGAGNIAADSSGNGNDGELMGDPVWIAGKFGRALEFDGDGDFVSIADADSLDMTNAVTVMLCFKTYKEMAKFGDRQAVVGKCYLEYEVCIYPNGTVHTYTNDGTGGYDEGINAAVPAATWVLGQWYHLAWTLDGTHESVYVDGTLIGEFDKPHAGTLAGTHALQIGERGEGCMPHGGGGSLMFTGAIDEVAVLNVALGESDINDAMNRGMASVINIPAVSAADKLATTWGKLKAK